MLIIAANIAFLIWAIRWIKSLGACECAKGLKRDFMQLYFSVSIIFQFSLLLGLNRMLNWPMLGLAIAYGFVAMNFIKDVESKLCECAGRARARWFYYLTLGQTLWAIQQVFSNY
jgi:hypothetical protein